jgi:hypothetical protein
VRAGLAVAFTAVAAVAAAACAYDRPPLADDAGADAPTDAPIADAALACTPSSCQSGVCLDGACVEDGTVVYVATEGVDDGQCRRTAPCRTIAHALAVASEPAIVAIGPGSFTEAITLRAPATLIGDNRDGGTATLLRPTVDPGIRIELEGAGVVALRDLSLIGAGVSCQGIGTVLDGRGLVVVDSRRVGVESRDCAIALRGGAIVEGELQGLDLVRGSLELRGVVIASNRRGGVRTREATAVVVTGSVLADNGEPTSPTGTGSPFGGAELVAAAVRFVGNTLVDNRAASASDAALRCEGNGDGDAYDNNLIMSEFAYAVTCPITHSVLVGAIEAPGGTNRVFDEVELVDPVGLDYHLRAPLPSTAPAPPADELDLDGQPRPLGSLDVGADEHP